MYTDKNFQTKRELKLAVAAYAEYATNPALWELNHAAPSSIGAIMGVRKPRPVTVYQPNADITGFATKMDGRVSVEGPHYPQPHKWYASVEIKGGIIIKILS